jgi:predicted amidophosphoribosyltransferase
LVGLLRGRNQTVANSNPVKIEGLWKEGFALDVHTLSSDYLGDDEFGHAIFRTTRSELGELLYRLKYQRDASAVDEIVEVAFAFVRSWNPGAEAIVPVPPTRATRPHQPVFTLAKALATRLVLPLHSEGVRLRKEIPELKDVFDLDARLRLLEGVHEVDPTVVAGRRVLLFDDLFRSGATMNAITKGLRAAGAAEVFALAITRSRSKR